MTLHLIVTRRGRSFLSPSNYSYLQESKDSFIRSLRKAKFWNPSKNTAEHIVTGVPKNRRNVSCPVFDFLAEVDGSVHSIESELMCDSFAQESDIVCRIYLRQIGLESLERLVCKLESTTKVPKIVYFLTFGDYEFHLRHYVAIVAAQRHVDPIALYIIGDQEPLGIYWSLVLRDVPGVRFVYREPPRQMSGHQIHFVQHKSDLVRLQTLYFNGGIYLDTDMVILRNIDQLLAVSPLTQDESIADTKVPFMLYQNDTSRLVEIGDKIYRPHWRENALLTNGTYDWSQNYAMHIWGSAKPQPESTEEINSANTTICEVLRYILYGNPAPIT
uniref:Alpha-1,4-N-acetylglucosaminyltransferase n=1 Tax=Biomphalaria glabrata TaxID=6526 RepID=A0A2C9KNF3_BIOGL